jgi:hypothetical protein
MERRDLFRGVVLAGICMGVLAYDWGYLAWPMHRVMALLIMTAVFSFAWFYEMTVRDAPMGRVLAGVLAIMGGALLLWGVLTLFARPLPNDATPLMPAGETLDAQACHAPSTALMAAVGPDRIAHAGRGPFTPFKIAGCSGPSLTVTPKGLVVDHFGYDGDGSVVFRIRRNLFDLIQGEWLHMHRPDRSALGVYDEWENEILYVRYLNPGQVRIRGRFLCGEYPPVTIKEETVRIGDARLGQPACLLDRQRRY